MQVGKPENSQHPDKIQCLGTIYWVIIEQGEGPAQRLSPMQAFMLLPILSSGQGLKK